MSNSILWVVTILWTFMFLLCWKQAAIKLQYSDININNIHLCDISWSLLQAANIFGKNWKHTCLGKPTHQPLRTIEEWTYLLTYLLWHKSKNFIFQQTGCFVFGELHRQLFTFSSFIFPLFCRPGALAWNADLLASGSRDRVIMLRDTRCPSDASEKKFVGHRQEVRISTFALSRLIFFIWLYSSCCVPRLCARYNE